MSDATDPKPLPCPFCGGTRIMEHVERVDGEPRYFKLSCGQCDAVGPWSDNREAGVLAWNRRGGSPDQPPPPPPAGPTVRVRVAVAVEDDGWWCAAGDQKYTDPMKALDELFVWNPAARIVFIEADVSLPAPPAVVAGRVAGEGGESDG